MRYRIKLGEAYNGCIPVSVWYVQVKKDTMFGVSEWVKVKGYQERRKAEKLLRILTGEIKI